MSAAKKKTESWTRGFCVTLGCSQVPLCSLPPPQNAKRLPRSHTKSWRETDREEISLKEKHIRLQHLDTQAYSPERHANANAADLAADWTVCFTRCTLNSKNKAHGPTVPSITGWCCLKYISTNKYLKQRSAPRLPPQQNRLETLPPPSSLLLQTPSAPEEDSPSGLHHTGHICNPAKPPTLFFLSGRKQDTPPPVSKKKKPPPTGLAGYNGPPKECFPLHALSPLPMAEQRERDGGRQRGVTFLSALSPRWLPASLTASLFRSTS